TRDPSREAPMPELAFDIPLIEREGAKPRPGAAERAVRVLLALSAIVAAAAAAVVLVPPFLRVARYDIVGARSLSRDDVLTAALVHGTEYFYSADPDRMEAALESDPRLSSASVDRVFPNAFRIAVAERVPVAAVVADLGGRAGVVLMDAEGVVFSEADPSAVSSLPVVSGIRFEDLRMGARLPASLVPLLAAIGAIGRDEPALLAAFSEIRIVKPRLGGYELLLYPLEHRVPVRAKAALSAVTLRSIILVLDVLGTRGIADEVEEIDFRTGTVVYRGKEGHPG
ncbi:MAG: FtsQ-type POTRA domain-containing protein, partial [Spirochaetaceae bacterium]|nr:FtsQ-type POTRA domain-containing protein [Spirochaetaceae bacterium]